MLITLLQCRVSIVQFEHQTCFAQEALVRCSLTCVDLTYFTRVILKRNSRLPHATHCFNLTKNLGLKVHSYFRRILGRVPLGRRRLTFVFYRDGRYYLRDLFMTSCEYGENHDISSSHMFEVSVQVRSDELRFKITNDINILQTKVLCLKLNIA